MKAVIHLSIFLKSLVFSKFLKLYKEEFIEDLNTRRSTQIEAQQKVSFIHAITARDYLKLLKDEAQDYSAEKKTALVKFLDGGFHQLPQHHLFSSDQAA